MKPIAEVRSFLGKSYLSVCGYALAMEGDICRDMKVVVEEGSSVGEAYSRNDVWTESRLEKIAEVINERMNNA